MVAQYSQLAAAAAAAAGLPAPFGASADLGASQFGARPSLSVNPYALPQQGGLAFNPYDQQQGQGGRQPQQQQQQQQHDERGYTGKKY
jgi:hypothetical protein